MPRRDSPTVRGEQLCPSFILCPGPPPQARMTGSRGGGGCSPAAMYRCPFCTLVPCLSRQHPYVTSTRRSRPVHHELSARVFRFLSAVALPRGESRRGWVAISAAHPCAAGQRFLEPDSPSDGLHLERALAWCTACAHFVVYLIGQSLAPAFTPPVPRWGQSRSPIRVLSWQGLRFRNGSARGRGVN